MESGRPGATIQIRVIGSDIRTFRPQRQKMKLTVWIDETDRRVTEVDPCPNPQFKPVVFDIDPGVSSDLCIHFRIEYDDIRKITREITHRWVPLTGMKFVELYKQGSEVFSAHISSFLGSMRTWPLWTLQLHGHDFPKLHLCQRLDYFFEVYVRVANISVKIYESESSRDLKWRPFQLKQEWNDKDNIQLLFKSRGSDSVGYLDLKVEQFLSLMPHQKLAVKTSGRDWHVIVAASPVRSRVWLFRHPPVKLQAFVVVDLALQNSEELRKEELNIQKWVRDLRAEEVSRVFVNFFSVEGGQSQPYFQECQCGDPITFPERAPSFPNVMKKIEQKGQKDCSEEKLQERFRNQGASVCYYSIVIIFSSRNVERVYGPDFPISVFTNVKSVRELQRLEQDMDDWAKRYSFGSEATWKMCSLMKEYYSDDGQNLIYFSDLDAVLKCSLPRQALGEEQQELWQWLRQRMTSDPETVNTVLATMIGRAWLENKRQTELASAAGQYLVLQYGLPDNDDYHIKWSAIRPQ